MNKQRITFSLQWKKSIRRIESSREREKEREKRNVDSSNNYSDGKGNIGFFSSRVAISSHCQPFPDYFLPLHANDSDLSNPLPLEKLIFAG